MKEKIQIGMTKQEVKAIFGKPIKENKYCLQYEDDLEFHFKFDLKLYLAVINPLDFILDRGPVVLVFDETMKEPLNFILATVL